MTWEGVDESEGSDLEVVVAAEVLARLQEGRVELRRLGTRVLLGPEEDVLLQRVRGDVGAVHNHVVKAHAADLRDLLLREDPATKEVSA